MKRVIYYCCNFFFFSLVIFIFIFYYINIVDVTIVVAVVGTDLSLGSIWDRTCSMFTTFLLIPERRGIVFFGVLEEKD